MLANSLKKTKSFLRQQAVKAFTLIELMLALALFGLTAGIFIVHFDQIRETFFETANPEQILETTFQKARYYASREHKPMRVFFDSKKHLLCIKDALGKFYDETKFILAGKGILLEFFECEAAKWLENGWKPSGVLVRFLEFSTEGSSTHAFIKMNMQGESPIWHRLDPFSGRLMPENR